MNEHENESPVPTPEPEQPEAPTPEPEAPATESQAKLPEDPPPPQPESAQPQAEPAEKPDEPPAPPAPAEPPAAAPVAPQAAEPPAADAPPPAPAPPAPQPETPPAAQPTPARRATAAPDGHWWWGTGRRKAAVARVRIRPGSGKFIINRRKLDLYFTEERDRNDLTAVLQKTHTHGSLDVHVNVHGGGFTGQAGAIILGLGRALRRYDQSLEPILRDNGFLTRDPRRVERKKYGQRGARRRFQFSKR